MLVDFFPFLKHCPSWLPGMGWKRRADKIVELIHAFHNNPYKVVEAQMKNGTARPSFTATLIERLSEGKEVLSPEDEKDVLGTAGTLYAAGTETMASAMHTFMLAMVIHPDVYLKAQEEMDRVVGTARLPELDDRDSLPYLNAVIKETFRWHPSVPLGIPHASTQDDEYHGYRIPNNTMVISNLWGMSRDDTVYLNPQAFRPERFIVAPGDEEPMDPRTYVFGFGRRLCPGKDFAESCVFLVLANIVATMDILKPKDENGVDVTPEPLFTFGFASRPQPFECTLKPRSLQAFNLIQQQDTDIATFATE